MRIAFVSTFPPIECGIGTYTQYLSEAMRNEKKEVHIISQHGAMGRNVHATYDPHSDTIARDIFLTAFRISPDVIHIEHEFGLFGEHHGVQVIELVLRLKMAGLPCVVSLHTVRQNMTVNEAIILENLVGNCEMVIVHEQYQKDLLLKQFEGKGNIKVVPHGIRNVLPIANAKEQIGVTGKQVVLLAGFFRPTKYFDRLVKIFPRVVEHLPNACLLIAGKMRGLQYADYQKTFFQLINDSEVRENIVVLRGQFPQETFDTILCAADIMAFPYVAGAQSGVMAHSAAFNIPVVTSDLKSFAEWNEKCGGGITAHTDEEYVNGIVKMFTDNEFYLKCKKKIRDYIKPLQWESISKIHIKLYEEIIRVPYGKARYFDVPVT